MAGGVDRKRALRTAQFARQFARWVKAGTIPPMSVPFLNSEVREVTDRRKKNLAFLQIGFVVTNARNEVLSINRQKFQTKQQPAGHTTTLGSSVLVSWSPVENNRHQPFPRSQEDIEFYYRKEVKDNSGSAPPDFRFLGLIHSHLSRWNLDYFFYVWEARYPIKRARPPFTRLQKDEDDVLGRFQPISPALLKSLANRGADLRALQALAHRIPLRWDDTGIEYGESTWASPTRDPYLELPPHVFISHTDADLFIARRIKAKLKEAGVVAWLDNDDLDGGQPWFNRVEPVLELVPIFMVLCSAASRGAPGVLQEIIDVLTLRRRRTASGIKAFPNVLPLALTGDNERSHIPRKLANFPISDLRFPKIRTSAMAKVVESCQRLLDEVLPGWRTRPKRKQVGS